MEILEKVEYIIKSISKISRKKWEFFIISRIIHKLDDDDIEFVTQQCIRRPNGEYYLTDLYFPQFDIHLEVDEPFHSNKIEEDQRRENDIVLATEHQIKRIKISDQGQNQSLSSIRSEVDEFVEFIRFLKIEKLRTNEFSPWDWEHKFSSKPIIERGYLDVADNVTFRTQIEAMRCFGFSGNGYQRGAWTIPDGSTDIIWFPRLYKHFIWHNELSPDGRHIYERALDEEGRVSIAKQIKDARAKPDSKMIVFAKSKDTLGANLLRYVGTFKINFDESSLDLIQFDLVRTREPVRLEY